MNLYKVYPALEEWCCYVFHETPNKAKLSLVGYFDNDNTYIDFRCKTVKKDVGGEPQVCDTDCKRLADLGVRYWTQEEIDAYESAI